MPRSIIIDNAADLSHSQMMKRAISMVRPAVMESFS